MNNKEIPCSPLLFCENKFIISSQCTLVENSSKLLLEYERKKRNSIYTIEFTNNDIEKMISIHVLKVCESSIFQPHQLMFKSCIKKVGSIFEEKK